VAARLKLVNQQIKQAHRRLDELSDKLAEGREEDAPGQKSKQRDVTILRSLPGVGRIVLATLLARPRSLCAKEIIMRCAPCPASPR
jgi:hypothetical protein